MLEKTGIEAVAKNTDDFFNKLGKMSKSVSNFRGEVEEVPSALDRMNASIGKLAFGGLVAGAAAFVALGVAAVAAGYKVAQSIAGMTMEAARVQEMSGVLYLLAERANISADAIDKEVESIKNLGIRTDTAQSLLAQFLRYQLDSADAAKLARVAQDAAVYSMKDSSEALDDLLHGILTQNTMVLRNAGLTVNVQKALDDYAKSIGKATSALTEEERIQAVLNGVLAEGEKIAGTYERAMEEPGKQWRSMTRYFYEARVEIGKFFLPVFSKVVDFLKKFGKGLQSSLAEGKPLNKFFMMLAEYANQVFGLLDPLGKMIDLFFKGETVSLKFMAQLKKLFGDDLGGQIYQFVRLIDAAIKALSSGDWSAVRDILPQWVVDLWDDLVVAWNNIKSAWEDNLKPALDKLSQWFSENSEMLISSASGISGSLLDIASQAVLDGMKLLSEYIEKFVTWLTEHKEDITDALDKVQEFIDQHGDAIKNWFLTMAAISLANLVVQLAGMAVSLVAVAAPAAGLALVAAAISTLYTLGEQLAKSDISDEDWEKLAPSEKVVASITAAWQEIGDAIRGEARSELGQELNDTGRELGSQIADGIIQGLIAPLYETKIGTDILTALGDSIELAAAGGGWANFDPSMIWQVNFTEKIVERMKESFKSIFEATTAVEAEGGVPPYLQGLSGAMENPSFIDRLAQALTNALDQAKAKVMEIIGGWTDIGKSIIDGIVEGIKSNAAKVAEILKNIIDEAIQAAKDLLGISSPSKLFKDIGENTMRGMEKGIKEAAYRPAKAVESAVGAVASEKNYYSERTTNVLEGATVYNNTEFDLQAFTSAVRNA